MTTNTALLLVLLGLACTAPCQAAEAAQESPGVIQKVENAVARGAQAAASGVQRGAKATARGLERAASATAHGVKVAASGVSRGANATARGVEKAANKVKGTDSPAPAASK